MGKIVIGIIVVAIVVAVAILYRRHRVKERDALMISGRNSRQNNKSL